MEGQGISQTPVPKNLEPVPRRAGERRDFLDGDQDVFIIVGLGGFLRPSCPRSFGGMKDADAGTTYDRTLRDRLLMATTKS